MKRKFALLSLLTGAVLLVLQIASTNNNYYLQSMGVLFLMIGIYSLTTTIRKTESTENQITDEKKNRVGSKN